MIENIECNTVITSDSAANLLLEIWGELPKDKKKILDAIDNFLVMDDKKKIEFSLKRRLEAFESQYGEVSDTIQKKVNKLSHYPEKNAIYFENVKKLIKFIRKRLIP